MFTKVEQFPVFMMCGRAPVRRQLMKVLDPDKYPIKGLLPFLGKRIVDWQIEALASPPYVQKIYLLCLCEEQASSIVAAQYIPTDLRSNPAGITADWRVMRRRDGINHPLAF